MCFCGVDPTQPAMMMIVRVGQRPVAQHLNENFACHDAVDAIVTRHSHITVSTASKSYVKSISCEIHPHLQDGGSICSSISDSSSVSDSSNSSVADRSSCHCVIAAIADRCCSHRVVAAIADWCCSHCVHWCCIADWCCGCIADWSSICCGRGSICCGGRGSIRHWRGVSGSVCAIIGTHSADRESVVSSECGCAEHRCEMLSEM
jgi:hypothetical protein